MIQRVTGFAAVLVVVLGVVGCSFDKPRRKLFNFSAPSKQDPALVAGEVPVKERGEDAYSYKVPARNLLWLSDGGPTYHGYNENSYDEYFGAGYRQGEDYVEGEFPSGYYLVPSKEPVLPEGNQILGFTAEAAQTRVSSAGGSVDVRVQVTAPGNAMTRSSSVNLAILLDFSASIGEPNKIVPMREAAHHLVDQILPGDRVAVLAFGADVTTLLSSNETPDLPELHNRIDRIEPAGSGQLGPALLAAYSEVEAAVDGGGGVGHVVLVSDGLAAKGRTGGWRLVEVARAQRTGKALRLTTIGVGNQMDPKFLVELARAGEGRFAYVRNEKEVSSVLGRELQSLFRVYAHDLLLHVKMDNGGQVVSVHGAEFAEPLDGVTELTLSNMTAGESRSLLFRLKFPPTEAGEEFDNRFILKYAKLGGTQRTTIPRTVTVRATAIARAPENQEVQDYARVVLGMEQIRRAIESGQEDVANLALAMFEKEFPAIKTRVLAGTDRDLQRQARLFDYFAARLKSIVLQGRLRGASLEREELKKELYYRRNSLPRA